MQLLDARAMAEPIVPELDYFTNEPVQYAVIQSDPVKIDPFSDTYKSGGDLKFDIPKSECATSLHESVLHLKVKITKEDGSSCNHAAASSPDDVSVVNNPFHSIWKQLTVSLNKHETEKIDNYPYRAYISVLTGFSHDVLKLRHELNGWEKDTAGQFNDKSLATSGKNLGLIKRTEKFKNSQVVELVGRLCSDVMNQGRAIPPNTEIEICLSRSSHDFVLMSGKTSPSYKLHILSAELYVQRDKLAPSLHITHSELTSKYNLLIKHRHSKVVTYNLPKDAFSGTIKNVFSSATHLPDRVMAFIVTNKAFSGSYDTNPLEFAHHNLKRIAAVVNESRTVPPGGYKPNFTSGMTAIEYYSFLRELNADEENFMVDVTKTDYNNGYTIYPFRIVPRSRGGDLLGPPANGTISIEYEFSTALEHACTLVLMGEFRGSFEIREGGDFAPVMNIP
jgi:hypothetical protein